jgi:hypothetical protein
MKGLRWQIVLAALLIVLSGILYIIHYEVFHDARNIFFYGIMDIAFIPVQVLLVTLIIHNLLAMRERASMLRKLNMVIGVFYSECGTVLLRHLSAVDQDVHKIRQNMEIGKDWTASDFAVLKKRLQGHHFNVAVSPESLTILRQFLTEQRAFLLSLLENPNLLEHEAFTDLLWAVFHLSEELSFRQSTYGLPANDMAHLAGDAKRAYRLLVLEWLAYMNHLRNSYPYLFSLAVRTNPFAVEANVIVT